MTATGKELVTLNQLKTFKDSLGGVSIKSGILQNNDSNVDGIKLFSSTYQTIISLGAIQYSYDEPRPDLSHTYSGFVGIDLIGIHSRTVSGYDSPEATLTFRGYSGEPTYPQLYPSGYKDDNVDLYAHEFHGSSGVSVGVGGERVWITSGGAGKLSIMGASGRKQIIDMTLSDQDFDDYLGLSTELD